MSIEKYLSEDKTKRYLELINKGVDSSIVETGEYRELGALRSESIAKQVELYGEPKPSPFEGKCRRCGVKFTDPCPVVTNDEGIPEIASMEWCADCNQYVMNIVFRYGSAYKASPGTLNDPFRGGHYGNS
jgi:hypothetical protein